MHQVCSVGESAVSGLAWSLLAALLHTPSPWSEAPYVPLHTLQGAVKICRRQL